MLLVALCLLAMTDPITPTQLKEALQSPPKGAEAEALAARIRAAFPEGTDLKSGKHAPLIDKDNETVAFVLQARRGPTPRVAGMVNHGRGWDMIPIGDTGLWARVETIPADTKFSYHYEVGTRRLGERAVEMPGWSYPPESKPRPSMKYGEYIPLQFHSKVFGNERTGWIYVPASYSDASAPWSLLIVQDGDAYRREGIGTVVENLMADGEIPSLIVVGLNPGAREDGTSTRSLEYDTLGPDYATFLEKEVLPLLDKYSLRNDPASRALAGASSGGICAFTAAWERPSVFGRVLSQIGSFTDIRGGHAYPDLVRKERKKPIKVVLTDGTNDYIIPYGDWWQANQAMYAALKEKGYDVAFLQDHGFHAYWTCGRQLPEALRLLWSDTKKKKK
jgi:enterochelin esterase-like enzyme